MPPWRGQGVVDLNLTLLRLTGYIRREQVEGRARGRSERRFVLLMGVVAFRHPEFIASMVVE
jgi:hypothetical protein